MLQAPIAEYKRSAHSVQTSKKTPRRGASRSPVKVEAVFSLAYLLKLLAVGATAAAITAGLVWFDPKEKISRLSSKPIREVKLEGEFKYIGKSFASDWVANLIDGSFIELDIATLKEKIEQHPWIDAVTITRQWPDKLIVRINEQQPIAQWGEKSFLNMKGDIIKVEKTTNIKALPKLGGADVFAKQIMQQYLMMNKIIMQSDLKLKAVDMDATKAWQITLNDDIQVKLGREKVLQNLQTLVKVSQSTIKDEFNKIQSIDMRYPSGFAVAWKHTSEQYMAER